VKGSYFHLLSLSNEISMNTRENLWTLSRSLYSSFFSPDERHAGGSDPKQACGRDSHEDRLPSSEVLPEADDLERLHSLIVMHGWEMVNAAGWNVRQHLWCQCPKTGPTRCQHIIDMIHQGASMIRAAGDTPWIITQDFQIDFKALQEIQWFRRLIAPFVPFITTYGHHLMK
jgi:hypothetical protein